MAEFLRTKVPSWFGRSRYTYQGSSIIIQVASRGLPRSRHYNPVAADLQTQGAPARLKRYEDLLEMLSGELGAPIYLIEQSRDQVRNICGNGRDFMAMSSDLLKFLPDQKPDPPEHLAKWNPAVRLHLECGLDIKSVWPEPLTDYSEHVLAVRLRFLIHELEHEKRRHPGRIPVCIIFTENDVDLQIPLQKHNFPYFPRIPIPHHIEELVELFTITEPW